MQPACSKSKQQVSGLETQLVALNATLLKPQKATKIEPETVLWPGTLLIMLKSDVVGRFLGDF